MCVCFWFKGAIFEVKVLLSKWVLLFVLKNIIYKNHPNEYLTYSVVEVTSSQLSRFDVEAVKRYPSSLERVILVLFIRFMKMEDRKRALVSRLLQYALVHQVSGIPFGEIIIRRTVEGKPYLV